MRWSFGHFTFDADREILQEGEDNRVLEPKAAALLRYFCQHHQRDLSRDELIEHVWHGQTVSDNAINRVVVQLRKALADERKPRRFIATVPKVGYRFIGRPRQIVSAPQVVEAPTPDPRARWLITGFVALLLMGLSMAWLTPRINAPEPVVSVEPVSREVGWQFEADLSPDERLLLYSVSEPAGSVLYLQDLSKGRITRVSASNGEARGARWSHDGQYFVYIFHQNDRCSFHRVDIDTSGKILSDQRLQTCPLNSDANVALSLDDDILYFVERPNAFSPYVAYAFDMQEQQRWALAQPMATSFGNHYLDVHPQTGKVLLLSEPRPGTSAVYEVDVAANTFRRLHAFDYDLYSAVWGHEAQSVVHPAEHPSYQLLKTDVTTGVSQVLVSDSRRISTPRRINNGRDYLFASYLYNRDIDVEGYDGPNFNSAVMDYLPEFSHSGRQLAFVSKRAGFSEVMVLDLDTDELTTLTTDDQGMTFYNLAWSANDQSLAANTSKGIVLYDLMAATQRVLPIDQLTYAVDWYTDTQLSYSQYVEGRWHAYVRDLGTHETRRLPDGVIFSATDAKRHLHVYSGYAVLLGDAPGAGARVDLSSCSVRYLSRFQSNLKFSDGRVLCPSAGNASELLSILPQRPAEVWSSRMADAQFYSVSGRRLAKAWVNTASSDVMRTRADRKLSP